MNRLSRNDSSLLAEWWFTIDRVLLAVILALAAAGLVLSLAASPAVAVKKGFSPYHFVERQVVFVAIAVTALFVVSMLGPRNIRRLALLLFAGMIAAMIAVLIAGEEINGARRWLRFAGFSLQPSEFAKPAFVVISAWGLAEARERRDMPGLAIAVAAFVVLAAVLAQQPDVGQTLLVTLVWAAMLMMAGQPIAWVVGLAGVSVAGLGAAYLMLPYVRLRIDRFFSQAPGDNSQAERALQSFIEGGFFGRGPGEGTIKSVLPDAHTDFIFAVVAEEYGVLACLALLALFGFIVVRTFVRTLDEPDLFVRLCATGLVMMLGLQALINMAVNVGLVPPKGITLPFVSAGGSSTVAVGIAFGMVLALGRRRPRLLASRGRIAAAGELNQGRLVR